MGRRVRCGVGRYPAVVEGVVAFGVLADNLVFGIAVEPAAKLHGMFSLGHGEAKYLVKVLGAVGPGIVARAPLAGAAAVWDGAPGDVRQAIAYVINRREVCSSAPARGLGKAGRDC